MANTGKNRKARRIQSSPEKKQEVETPTKSTTATKKPKPMKVGQQENISTNYNRQQRFRTTNTQKTGETEKK